MRQLRVLNLCSVSRHLSPLESYCIITLVGGESSHTSLIGTLSLDTNLPTMASLNHEISIEFAKLLERYILQDDAGTSC